MANPPVVILDIDGTLVDSNYHHTRSWSRAFAQHGVVVPIWKVHRAIGMGGDQLIGEVAGDDVETDLGDEIRAAEGALYLDLIDEVGLLPGARDLISGAAERGARVVLASSAKEREVDHYLGLLDAGDAIYASTSSADVDATKPAPDLLEAARGKAESKGPALLVGDSVWDCRAAGNAGIATLGVLTGGFGEAELRAAGAAAIYEGAPGVLDSPELARHLAVTN